MTYTLRSVAETSVGGFAAGGRCARNRDRGMMLVQALRLGRPRERASLFGRNMMARHVPLEGAQNFRNFGGYVAEGGRRVRVSQIRSLSFGTVKDSGIDSDLD
jgi:hypothetical protein